MTKIKMDTNLWILLAAAVLLLLNYFKDKSDDKKQSAIEELAKLNNELGEKVHHLSELNNSISLRIDTVVNENKVLTEENFDLTKKAKAVTDSIESITQNLTKVTDELKNQITGEGTVPVIKAGLWFESGRDYATFKLTRVGSYPLNYIKIEYTDRYAAQQNLDNRTITPQEFSKFRDKIYVVNVDFLGANDILEVIKLQYPIGTKEDATRYSFDVYWRDENYRYTVVFGRIVYNRMEIKAENYSYKGQSYSSFDEFKAAILSNKVN
jgi:hypothetical protein